MTAVPAARLDLLTERPAIGGPVVLKLTLFNDTERDVAVVDPEAGEPPAALAWRASAAAYRAALLISVRVLHIDLAGPRGEPVPSLGLTPWVTPLLGTRTLRPGDRLTLELDLAELFDIAQAGPHSVRVGYGKDSASRVTAETGFVVGPRVEVDR